jgi:hypothetical protein
MYTLQMSKREVFYTVPEVLHQLQRTPIDTYLDLTRADSFPNVNGRETSMVTPAHPPTAGAVLNACPWLDRNQFPVLRPGGSSSTPYAHTNLQDLGEIPTRNVGMICVP